MKKTKEFYPKYTREQDLRCKLTDEDIKKLRELYGVYSYSELAETFNVSFATVWRWVKSDEEIKRMSKEGYRMRKERNYIWEGDGQHKFWERKKKIFPQKLVYYKKIRQKRDYQKNREYISLRCHQHYQKNKKRMLAKNKEWRDKNPNYNKEYYEGNKKRLLKWCHRYYQKNREKILKRERLRYKRNKCVVGGI